MQNAADMNLLQIKFSLRAAILFDTYNNSETGGFWTVVPKVASILHTLILSTINDGSLGWLCSANTMRFVVVPLKT